VSRNPARRLGQHHSDEDARARGDDASKPVDPPRHAPSPDDEYVVAWQLEALEESG
jgi:hypothetical protein